MAIKQLWCIARKSQSFSSNLQSSTGYRTKIDGKETQLIKSVSNWPNLSIHVHAYVIKCDIPIPLRSSYSKFYRAWKTKYRNVVQSPIAKNLGMIFWSAAYIFAGVLEYQYSPRTYVVFVWQLQLPDGVCKTDNVQYVI